MKARHVTIVGIIFFALVWGGLFHSRSSIPPAEIFSNDAEEYSGAAVHLVQSGMYSLDGDTPFFEREPGQSIFLASIYLFFGIENHIAIFLVQGLLYLIAVIVFIRELRRHSSDHLATICFVLLLIQPTIYHIIFSAYRESFALSLFLFYAALFLSFLRHQTWQRAVGLGVLLGGIVLTYIPFLFFSLFLIPLVFFLRLPKRYLFSLVCIPFLVVSLWGVRNALHDGNFRLTNSFRTSIMWYARAEQAERVQGIEPFRCLWAEYISRDWSTVSDACSTTALFHRKWEGSVPSGEEHLIARESQRKILKFLPHYLWFSAFEIVELHLPYVNGWGFIYNVLAALSSVILYCGCALAWRQIFRREYLLFTALILYSTAIFALTDATPRYLMPTIFCYAVLAAVGYATALERLKNS